MSPSSNLRLWTKAGVWLILIRNIGLIAMSWAYLYLTLNETDLVMFLAERLFDVYFMLSIISTLKFFEGFRTVGFRNVHWKCSSYGSFFQNYTSFLLPFMADMVISSLCISGLMTLGIYFCIFTMTDTKVCEIYYGTPIMAAAIAILGLHLFILVCSNQLRKLVNVIRIEKVESNINRNSVVTFRQSTLKKRQTQLPDDEFHEISFSRLQDSLFIWWLRWKWNPKAHSISC